MADSVKPIAPKRGMPLIFGGISAITKRAEPMDSAAIITA